MTILKTGGEALRRMAFAVALLALAFLTFTPTVEAAVCGYELSEASSVLHVEPSDPEHDTDAGDPEQHADCSHGHCHHRAPGRTSGAEDISRQLTITSVGLHWTSGLAPPSNLPPRLEHPPRA